MPDADGYMLEEDLDEAKRLYEGKVIRFIPGGEVCLVTKIEPYAAYYGSPYDRVHDRLIMHTQRPRIDDSRRYICQPEIEVWGADA